MTPSFFLGGIYLLKCFPTISLFKSTAITISAPSARQVDTGTGLTKPPSTSHLLFVFIAGNNPGNEIDDQTASKTDPLFKQISFPVSKSVAIAAYSFPKSSITALSDATYLFKK